MELVNYLTKNQDYIINYELMNSIGNIIGRGRIEKYNDIIVAKRQKQKFMAWFSAGSKKLALVTAQIYNSAA